MPFLPYDQNQSFLFPPHLYDWVTDNHPARIFSDLIDKLTIAGFNNAAVEGRPRYDTRMMLKVLLWAYANGIRASRKIEERLRSDVVFMWLSGRQTPDFHTICDFRRCNEAAIDRLDRIHLSDQSADESRRILSHFIRHILGRELKSVHVLNEIRRLRI